MQPIARTVAKQFHSPAVLPPVLAILGPRAAGKTSLARFHFPTHRHITLSLPSEAAQAELDPAAFLARLPPYVVIDDIHLGPRLIQHIAHETARRPYPSGSFVLTGSMPMAIATVVDDAFAGDLRRCRVMYVDGLSHAEVTAARPDIPLTGRLLRGGFPALYADPDANAGEFMRSLVAEHLAHELPLQLRVDNIHDYERFLRALAQRSGRLLNKADLAREIGIAGSTAAVWLNTLLEAGMVSLVRPWQPPHGKPLVKTPKVYFRDTGLCAALLGIRTEADLVDSPHASMLWETLVAGELRRLLAAAAPQTEITFWRDRTKGIDFLLPSTRGLVMVDAIWSEFPSSTAIGRLLRVRDAIGPEAVDRVTIVCRPPAHESLREPRGPLVETLGLDDLPCLLD